jgi:hypothetical protein
MWHVISAGSRSRSTRRRVTSAVSPRSGAACRRRLPLRAGANIESRLVEGVSGRAGSAAMEREAGVCGAARCAWRRGGWAHHVARVHAVRNRAPLASHGALIAVFTSQMETAPLQNGMLGAGGRLPKARHGRACRTIRHHCGCCSVCCICLLACAFCIHIVTSLHLPFNSHQSRRLGRGGGRTKE